MLESGDRRIVFPKHSYNIMLVHFTVEGWHISNNEACGQVVISCSS